MSWSVNLRADLPRPSGAGEPTWLSGQPDKKWLNPLDNSAAISANKHWLGASAIVDPVEGGVNHKAVYDAYCGMGWCQVTKSGFTLANGGHVDYFGNEVYSFDLSANAPQYKRRRNSDAHEGSSGTVTKWSTGRPASDHSGAMLLGAAGEWLKCGHGGCNYTGNQATKQWWKYDYTTLEDYVDLGVTRSDSDGGTNSVAAVYDPVNDQIITVRSSNSSSAKALAFARRSDKVETGTSTYIFPFGGGVLAAFDSTNNIVLAKYDGSDTDFYAFKTPYTSNPTLITATGTPAFPRTQNFYWHAASGCYVTWNGGQGIGKLTPTGMSGGMYTGLVYSQVTSTTGVTVQSDNFLMYGKVGLIDNMGGGRSLLVVVSRYAFPDVYALALPSAGV